MSKLNYYVDKNNCAPCSLKENKNKKFKTCYSKKSLEKIANLWNEDNSNKIKIKNQSKEQLWKQIQNNLKIVCKDDESCWKKQDFLKKIKDIDIEMYTFKPNYPKAWYKNPTTWLNTYDIYFVMKQYEKLYSDFIFMGPIPADCPTKIQCELSKLNLMNLKKQKIFKIGIVYNLDTSNQPGSHWTAIYIDNKRNEINYYDSYGSFPTYLIDKFIKKIIDQYKSNNLNPTVIYNDKRHQFGNSECGMFSMNFILQRLHNTTMYDISQMTIPDEKMIHLRKLLYNVNL